MSPRCLPSLTNPLLQSLAMVSNDWHGELIMRQSLESRCFQAREDFLSAMTVFCGFWFWLVRLLPRP
jgi:hypothetical protein